MEGNKGNGLGPGIESPVKLHTLCFNKKSTHFSLNTWHTTKDSELTLQQRLMVCASSDESLFR